MLQTAKSSKLQKPFQHTWNFCARFPKGGKTKTKMDDFARIHMHRLTCQRNTLPCAPSILKHCVSAEVCLLGHQWISRGFALRKVQYHQYTRSRKIHWTLITQEMRKNLEIDFFPRNVLWTFLWDPTEKRQYPKFPSLPPPPKKKFDVFADWVGLFEIYFRSSEMTDPRPCPRGWAYFRAPSCSTVTCQAQANNKLSAAKIDIFRGQRNITGIDTPSQQTSISHDQRSNYFLSGEIWIQCRRPNFAL